MSCYLAVAQIDHFEGRVEEAHSALKKAKSLAMTHNLTPGQGEQISAIETAIYKPPTEIDQSTLPEPLTARAYREILDGILAREWKVRIALDGTRTDLLLRDQHLLPKMKKAGVFLICLGVESFFDRDLEEYNKGTALANAERAVKLLKKHGIDPMRFRAAADGTGGAPA